MKVAPQPYVGLTSRLFEGLSDPEVRTVLSAGQQLKFLENSVVTNQDHPADNFYLLLSGRGQFFFITRDGRKVVLHWLVPGDIFGGAAIIANRSTYIVSTEMVKDSMVASWDRCTIRGLAHKFPALIDNTLAICHDYLVLYSAAHEALTCHSARERVAHIVVRLAESLGQTTANGLEIDITNEELANAAAVTQFTVSRLLAEWQRIGAIQKSRNKLVVVSINKILLRVI